MKNTVDSLFCLCNVYFFRTSQIFNKGKVKAIMTIVTLNNGCVYRSQFSKYQYVCIQGSQHVCSSHSVTLLISNTPPPIVTQNTSKATWFLSKQAFLLLSKTQFFPEVYSCQLYNCNILLAFSFDSTDPSKNSLALKQSEVHWKNKFKIGGNVTANLKNYQKTFLALERPWSLWKTAIILYIWKYMLSEYLEVIICREAILKIFKVNMDRFMIFDVFSVFTKKIYSPRVLYFVLN